MKRLGITVILCGALLVGLPAAAAEETPPPPDGLDATLLEDGSLLITWDATSGPVDYRVYRNGESIATVSETEFIDSNPLLAGAYQVTIVSGGTESDPSDPLIVATLGADVEITSLPLTPMIADHPIKADLFTGNYPPGCNAILIGVQTSPPFVGAQVNHRCLDAWLDP